MTEPVGQPPEERGKRMGLLTGTLGPGDPYDAAIAAAENTAS